MSHLIVSVAVITVVGLASSYHTRRREHQHTAKAAEHTRHAVNTATGWRDVFEDTYRKLWHMAPGHPEWLTRNLQGSEQDKWEAIREQLADLEEEWLWP